MNKKNDYNEFLDSLEEDNDYMADSVSTIDFDDEESKPDAEELEYTISEHSETTSEHSPQEYVMEVPKEISSEPVLKNETVSPVKSESVGGWTVPLSKVSKSLEISEFDKSIYRFNKVVTPAGDDSKLFAVFYRDKDSEKWATWNSLLSKKKYNVVNLEEFVKDFTEKNELKGTPVVRHYPFYITWSMDVAKTTNVFDSDLAKNIFTIMSSIDGDSIEKIKSMINIMIINSYNGKKALGLNYTINFSMVNEGTTYNYKDYFILNNERHKLFHGSKKIELDIKDIDDIQEKITSNITKLKNYTDNIDDIVQKLSLKFTKHSKKVFLTLCAQLPDENKNLLHVLINASCALNKHYSVVEHINIQTVLTKIMYKALA